MELNSLPARPVFSPEGERIGYVKCAYICKNLGKLSSLCCVDEEENEFFLPAQSVSFEEEGVFAGTARERSPKGVPSPVGKAVFNRAGGYLGRCCGFDADSGVLTAEKKGARCVFPAACLKLGDAVIVSENKKSARSNENAIRVTKTAEKPPQNIGSDLLGKQLKKDVEGVAEKGDTVTAATLKLARRNNKLLELAANTLTE